MINEILRKWFGLTPITCETCEVLRAQLAGSERERRELLTRILERDKPDSVPQIPAEEPQAITPQFVPWRVKQQMLEAEDRKRAQLMKDKAQEISQLEKELGVASGENQ